VDFAGEQQTIVPRVIGRTEESKAAKTGARGPSRRWDKQSVLDEIEQVAGKDAVEVAQALIAWAEGRDGVDIGYGGGSQIGSAKLRLRDGGRVLLRPLRINSNGDVMVPFTEMRSQPPFDEPEMRGRLRTEINKAAADGNLLPDRVEWEPTFSLTALSDAKGQQRFIAAIEWALEEAKRVQPGPAGH